MSEAPDLMANVAAKPTVDVAAPRKPAAKQASRPALLSPLLAVIAAAPFGFLLWWLILVGVGALFSAPLK